MVWSLLSFGHHTVWKGDELKQTSSRSEYFKLSFYKKLSLRQWLSLFCSTARLWLWWTFVRGSKSNKKQQLDTLEEWGLAYNRAGEVIWNGVLWVRLWSQRHEPAATSHQQYTSVHTDVGTSGIIHMVGQHGAVIGRLSRKDQRNSSKWPHAGGGRAYTLLNHNGLKAGHYKSLRQALRSNDVRFSYVGGVMCWRREEALVWKGLM